MRALFALAVALACGSAGAECVAHSGERTAALVELYTSEGCNSCPPADRWLSSLGSRGYAPSRVVPLSLHVDYWDYIGWKDPYAKPDFAGRQRKLSQLQRLAFVYTPQVMLQGRDFRGWRDADTFDKAVARINARVAMARLSLRIEGVKNDAMAVHVDAFVTEEAQARDARLYVAAYENRLSGRVTAGENRGKVLVHDYVVLEWLGPFDIPAGGRRAARYELPLLPKAVPAHSGAAAFVQDRHSLEVLQALMLPACGG